MTHVGCKRAEEMNYYTQLTTTTTSQESTRWALQENTSSTCPVDQPLNNLSDNSRMKHLQKRSYYTHLLPVTVLSIFLLPLQVESWGGGGSSSSSSLDTTYFGNSFTRDWLYDSSSISLKVEGCVLGVVEDQSDFGCLEDESEDGTTNWYMMANCKRPQVAFSVYASDGSSTSCSSANFKESVSFRKSKSNLCCLLFGCRVLTYFDARSSSLTVCHEIRSCRVHLLPRNL
jgi:hypothetical protein